MTFFTRYFSRTKRRPLRLAAAFVLLIAFVLAPLAPLRIATAADYTIGAGASCAPLGTWDESTRTCTLIQDVNGSLAILGTDITLDGNGHAITGTGGGIGIDLRNRSDIRLQNVTLSHWQAGIFLLNTHTITIASTTFSHNTTGIEWHNSTGLTFTDNIIKDNGTGFYHQNSGSTMYWRDNAFQNNDHQVNILFSLSTQNLDIDTSNTLNGKPFYYLENESNTTHAISGEIGALYCIRCTNVTLGGFVIDGGNGPNGAGLTMWDSNDNTIRDAVMSNGNIGADLYGSDRNTFTNNTFRMTGGTPARPATGVSLTANSDDNRFFDNNFIEPEDTAATHPVFIHVSQHPASNSSGNVFFDAATGRGNYWSRFDASEEGCTDANSDNHCDHSFQPWFVPQGNFAGQLVDHYPWTNESAWQTPPVAECCSSVAFLPGIKATRLYEDTTKLWEPTVIEFDYRKLLMNENGESVHSGIYTNGAITHVPLKSLYRSFFEMMDELSAPGGVITDWESLPYDWRYDVRDIVANPVAIPNGASYRMIDKIEVLAGDSKTGKVTIIAHSNGGLVAKALVDALETEGKAHLVDRIMFVATPELGTPQAVAALLHGDGEELPGKIFAGSLMNKTEAREMAETLSGAYGLLPSAAYFDRVISPVIEFGSGALLTDWQTRYKLAVNNPAELYSFLLGDDGLRAEPSANDIDTPNVLNATRLDEGESLHAALDNWEAPEGIETINIAGWGLQTLRGIKYVERTRSACRFEILMRCTKETYIDREPLMTTDGDEMVVVPSAEGKAGKIIYVDLPAQNAGLLSIDRDHANILEVDSLQLFIRNILEETEADLPQFIKSTKPTGGKKAIRLSVHSPVNIHAYDSSGNHVGRATTTIDGVDVSVIKEEIPNSVYMEFGEGKYLWLNGDSTTQYEITLDGLSTGTFTFEIQEIENDAVKHSAVYRDIPVTEDTVATLSLSSLLTATPFAVDIDGDGKTDATFTQDDSGELDLRAYLSLVQDTVKSMEMHIGLKISLLARLKVIEKFIGKKILAKADDAILRSIIKDIEKEAGKKKLTPEAAAVLIHMIERLREMVVE